MNKFNFWNRKKQGNKPANPQTNNQQVVAPAIKTDAKPEQINAKPAQANVKSEQINAKPEYQHKPDAKPQQFYHNIRPEHQQQKNEPNRPSNKFARKRNGRMRIIPLSSIEEVGKNIMVVEYGQDIIVIDCGMSFAGPEMLGVDYIVPDVSYLKARKRDIKAIIFTHGHLDHIGAIQYILPQLGNPQCLQQNLQRALLKTDYVSLVWIKARK